MNIIIFNKLNLNFKGHEYNEYNEDNRDNNAIDTGSDVSDTDSYSPSHTNIANDEDDSMSSDNEEHELDPVDHDAVYVDISKAGASQQQCVICNKKRCVKKKFRRCSDKAIIESYIKTGLMIQFGCRACVHHFNELGSLKQIS